MAGLRAVVQNGRLIFEGAIDLPEGTVLDLVLDDEGDNLSPEERDCLHRALAEAIQQMNAGEGTAAAEVIAGLRARD